MRYHLLSTLVVGVMTSVWPGSLAESVFYGLNYGINSDQCLTVEDLKSDFNAMKPYTNMIKTYTAAACNLSTMALEAAEAVDMRLYLGLWVDQYGTFETEYTALSNSLGQPGMSKVDAIVVGSEALYRNDTNSSTLASYVKRVKTLVSGRDIPVTVADVYYEFTPEVIDAVDFVTMNAFPYWEMVDVKNGSAVLLDHYQELVSKAKGKNVRIGETGWPTQGQSQGAAVASPENQRTYLEDVLCMVRQQHIDMIWFSAIDEPYRGDDEGSWGIMDANRTLKASLSMQDMIDPPCQQS